MPPSQSGGRRPTNKQLAVLAVLREFGEMTAKRISEILTERTPCAECNGTGEGDDSRRKWDDDRREYVERMCCRKCYGRGTYYFDYGTAYQACKRLVALGLAEEREMLDQWGDGLGRLTFVPVAAADPDDPLEKLWAMPEARTG